MTNRIKVLIFSLFFSAPFVQAFGDDIQVMRNMIERLIPQHVNQFEFFQTQGKEDVFKLESRDNKICISGNNANSMAVGLNHYLKYYCHTTVSWYASDQVEIPKVLPTVKQTIEYSAKCDKRFFLNYCTFGYTMPWWQWRDWERLIDWMALNGINMPLAITGQEYVWYLVWKKLGMTDQEIRDYFTGPAHLPWHRMSNLDNWQGSLPMEWLEGQCDLQKQILKREREFNMTPILPAFAGHVPQKLKTIYPQAKISQMSSWGGFADEYRSHFLDPLDELFPKIQKLFLEEQTKLFGTDHIYGADPFNEVMPPSWEPEFLANCSRHIYKSITDIDANATWLQMTWLFYIDRELWTNERVKAFLRAVPQDKMLLLDYYCENTEVWKQTDSYFGQPYLWCYLGNFGGNTMLSGNIEEVKKRIDRVYQKGGSNFSGLGSTLEGFDVNPFMYEFLFEQAWENERSVASWIDHLADRHLGRTDKNFRKAWQLLKDSIYTATANLGQGTLTNARPSFSGHGNWTTNPAVHYSNATLLKVWELMLNVKGRKSATYQYDIVNIGRQLLGNHFYLLREKFTKAYEKKQINDLQAIGNRMKEVLIDIDALLATQESFLVGKWINDASSMGKDTKSKQYYRENARNIITTWGAKDQSLNDYANRSWAGLTNSYYLPRWSMFIDDVIDATRNNSQFNEKSFHKRVTDMEWEFVKNDIYFTDKTQGDSYGKAMELFTKYKNEISK